MHEGYEEFGCKANVSKTVVSFPLAMGGTEVSTSLYEEEGGRKFLRWAGLLIDVQTLEVRADYCRCVVTPA